MLKKMIQKRITNKKDIVKTKMKRGHINTSKIKFKNAKILNSLTATTFLSAYYKLSAAVSLNVV